MSRPLSIDKEYMRQEFVLTQEDAKFDFQLRASEFSVLHFGLDIQAPYKDDPDLEIEVWLLVRGKGNTYHKACGFVWAGGDIPQVGGDEPNAGDPALMWDKNLDSKQKLRLTVHSTKVPVTFSGYFRAE